ncbi:MAG TPA: hypothetical protein VFU59_03845 [Candidatus Eisenbacteria bacterium]|nr:hypothetical protein [Candidatus Eisenbacteria bacterium]
MRGARPAGLVVAMAFVLGAATAEAKDPPPATNMARFDSVAASVALELLPPGAIPAGRPVEMTTPLPGDTLTLFEQRVVQRLRADGYAVRVAPALAAATIDPITGESRSAVPAPPAEGAVRLELRVESRGILYVKRLGKFPFGTKGYERLVSLQVQGRLVNAAAGDVLWAKTASKSARDVVPAGDVDVAASGSGMFRPAVPRGSSFGFLEPLIVTSVIAGLVILFYSNRT